MSALDVLQAVLDEIGVVKTSPELSTSTDKDIIEIRGFMNLSGQEIARRADFAGLFVTAFTGGNITEYTLPSQFLRLPSNGGTVRLNKTSSFTPVTPVVNDASWQLVKTLPSSSVKHYHLSGLKMNFSPVLDSDGAVVTYISKNWVDDVLNGSDEITDNGDSLLIPEKLVQKGTVWRWLRKKGMPYNDHVAEFEADLETELNSSRGGV